MEDFNSRMICGKCHSDDIISVSDSSSWSDHYYFKMYDSSSIHETMLKDRSRTNAYCEAILNNRHLFKDKIVLDVGCGTGILCLLAVKAGAKHCIGIDYSNIIEIAQKIVEDNHMEGKITLIKSMIEEAVLPPEYSKVDIIVSEWMGYCLLFENMLASVIFARDKWLTETGLIYPDMARLYIGAIESGPTIGGRFSWLDNIHGFNMSQIVKLAATDVLVETVPSYQNIVSEYCLLKEIDLYKVKVEDLSFEYTYQLRMMRDNCIDGLFTFFDVYFTNGKYPNSRIIKLSTSPESISTHWKQTVFIIDRLDVKMDEFIYGTFKMSPSEENKRSSNFEILVKHNNVNNHRFEKKYSFKLR